MASQNPYSAPQASLPVKRGEVMPFRWTVITCLFAFFGLLGWAGLFLKADAPELAHVARATIWMASALGVACGALALLREPAARWLAGLAVLLSACQLMMATVLTWLSALLTPPMPG